MQNVLNGVSMAVGVMEKALYLSYTRPNSAVEKAAGVTSKFTESGVALIASSGCRCGRRDHQDAVDDENVTLRVTDVE